MNADAEVANGSGGLGYQVLSFQGSAFVRFLEVGAWDWACAGDGHEKRGDKEVGGAHLGCGVVWCDFWERKIRRGECVKMVFYRWEKGLIEGRKTFGTLEEKTFSTLKFISF